MAERSAFVTGATGFIGRNLAEALVAADWRVTALHRPRSDTAALAALGVTLAEGDVLMPESLERAMPGAVDAVFHVAADTSMWSRHDARQTRVNVEGTRNVLAAARARGARRLVHTSTWNVYGLEQGDIHEELVHRGRGSWVNYTRTKALAEDAVREAIDDGLDAVIVNPAHVLGRYDAHAWARLVIAVFDRWLPGAPPGAGSFAHAAAVARAHVAAAEHGASGRNYLLGGADASVLELFAAIGEVTGRPVPRRALPAAVFRLVGRVEAGWGALTGREPQITPEGVAIACARARVVSDRARRELGYAGPGLAEMVEDCYRWLVASGRLPGPPA